MGGNPLISLEPDSDPNEHASETPVPEVLTEATKERREFVLLIKQVDKFNTVASRELVTPATCRECGFDVIRTNELEAWDTLTGEVQEGVIEALEAHIKASHTGSSAKIVFEDEIPTEWLGES